MSEYGYPQSEFNDPFSLKSISEFNNEYYIPSKIQRLNEDELKSLSSQIDSVSIRIKMENFKKSINAFLSQQKKEEDELRQSDKEELTQGSPIIVQPIISMTTPSLEQGKSTMLAALQNINKRHEDWYQKMIMPEYLKAKMDKAIENSLKWIEQSDEEKHQQYHLVHKQSIKNVHKDDGRKGLGYGGSSNLCLNSAEAAASHDKKASFASPHNTLYISNLPIDFSEEDLRILFSPQGRIKKLKLYKDNIGMLKGDGIVTYYDHNDAIKASYRFNGLDIGEGRKIRVVFADFTKAETETKAEASSSQASQAILSSSSEEILGATLKQFPPRYDELGNHSLFLLDYYNIAHAKNDANFLNILEMNLLSELNSFNPFTFDFLPISLFGKTTGVLGLIFPNEQVALTILSYFHSKGVSPIYHAGTSPVAPCSPISVPSLEPTLEPLETQIQRESEELDDFFNSLL